MTLALMLKIPFVILVKRQELKEHRIRERVSVTDTRPTKQQVFLTHPLPSQTFGIKENISTYLKYRIQE